MEVLAQVPGYIQAIAAVAGTVLAMWGYRWLRRDSEQAQFASKGSMQEMGRRVDDHEQRMAKLEARSDLLPTHDDLAGLRQDVNGVATGIAELNGQMSALQGQVSMINSYFVKGGARD